MTRRSITFRPETEKVIQDWRREQTPIPDYTDAVNILIQRYGAILALDQLSAKLEEAKE